MRFSLLLLAACSNAEAVAPAAAPTAAPVAPVAAPAAAPAAPAAAPDLPSRCPVGDQTHVEVYGFLEDELRAAKGNRAATHERLAYEVKLLRAGDMKPQRAGIVESETSHVLTTLCAGTPGCQAIGLYDRGGYALALSTHGDVVMPLGVGDDARWKQLQTAPGGTTFPLTAAERADTRATGMLVVFPVDGAIAACVVDPK